MKSGLTNSVLADKATEQIKIQKNNKIKIYIFISSDLPLGCQLESESVILNQTPPTLIFLPCEWVSLGVVVGVST